MLIDVHTCRITQSHQHPSSQFSKIIMWLCLSHSLAQSVLWKERRGENSVSWERCVSVSDVLLCWGCCPLPSVSDQPPILQARTLSISSHYSVTWNHRAHKPNRLLRLLNESNFLPESTERAHTSIATRNYLTLIQINKRHCHQGCATPQWHTMATHLYHYTRTATSAIPKMQSIISFKTSHTQNKSSGADWSLCHYTMSYTQYVMKISI